MAMPPTPALPHEGGGGDKSFPSPLNGEGGACARPALMLVLKRAICQYVTARTLWHPA